MKFLRNVLIDICVWLVFALAAIGTVWADNLVGFYGGFCLVMGFLSFFLSLISSNQTLPK